MEVKGLKTREEYAAVRQGVINQGLAFMKDTSLSKLNENEKSLLEHIFGHIFNEAYHAGRCSEHEYWKEKYLKKVASGHEEVYETPLKKAIARAVEQVGVPHKIYLDKHSDQ